MRANCWYGKKDVRVEQVPDPKILNRRDAIVKITSTAICGSDLHLFNGFMPTMEKGDVLGHEFMGEIVDIGPDVKNRRVGDRVVVSFPISCGNCFWQKKQLPQDIGKLTTTRSPTFLFLTSGPSSTISPMNSWPIMSPFCIVGMNPL